MHLEQPETVWSAQGLGVPAVLHLHYLAHRDRPLGAPWQGQFRDVLDATLVERRAMRRLPYLLASSPLVAEALRSSSRAEVAPHSVHVMYTWSTIMCAATMPHAAQRVMIPSSIA